MILFALGVGTGHILSSMPRSVTQSLSKQTIPRVVIAADVHESVVSFAQDAEATLYKLRVAFGALMQAAPVRVQRAIDLQRALSVDSALGWKIYRLATAPSPLAAAEFVPLPPAVRKVTRLARESGFDSAVVDAAIAAYSDFEELVSRHAGDRRTFDTMVSTLSPGAEQEPDIALRRSVFRGSAQLWGFQAPALYRCAIVHPPLPGTAGDRVDVLTLTGVIGLRQMRQVPPVTIKKRSVGRNSTGAAATEKSGPPTPVQLFEDYCSKPLPQFKTTTDAKGISDALSLDGIGLGSATTCFAYDLLRDLEDKGRSYAAAVNIPCEVLVIDYLLPRGEADVSTCKAAVYGNITDVDALRADPYAFPMPVREQALYLGHDLEALHDASVPRCPDMIRDMLTRLKWDDIEYDIFRCRVSFPLLSSIVRLHVEPSEEEGRG